MVELLHGEPVSRRRPPRPRRAPGCGSARPTRGTPRGRRRRAPAWSAYAGCPARRTSVEVVLGVDLDVGDARAPAGDVGQDPPGRPARRAERRGELQKRGALAQLRLPRRAVEHRHRRPPGGRARAADRVGSAEPAVEQRQRGPGDERDDDCARHDVHPAAHACFNRRCWWLLPRCGSRRPHRDLIAAEETWRSRISRPRTAAGTPPTSPGSMKYVAGSAVPTGWSPTSVEQAASTSASRVPGCRAAAAARSSARVIAPSPARHRTSVPAAAFAAAQ